MMVIAFIDAYGWIPAVGLYLTKELIVFHHPGAAWLVMLQPYKSSIAELLTPPRQVLRHDMSVYVYFE